ncbi:MAG: Ltp family lipoprotein [Propionibacteriaceae bacterium]|nr:Ltp family lipoprotein [Propionibacteriaceae bacterium]
MRGTMTAPTPSQFDGALPESHRAALAKAAVYLGFHPLSKRGLYNQLTSEHGDRFPDDAARYAVEHIEADWRAEALKAAISYRDTMNMDPAAIRAQLVSEYGEMFTRDEADHAITHL